MSTSQNLSAIGASSAPLKASSPAKSAAIGGDARVHAAIAKAAERTGIDFNYLLAKAKLESSLNPDARAPTSSATGLFQFIESTWLRTMDRHGAAFGMDQAADAIKVEGGRARVGHTATREAILAMRYDPEASALMAGALAQDNAQVLQSVLGREPDSPELYLAHFLGAGGASNFLSRMSADPDQSAAALMPKAAKANRNIFYQANGAARSLSGVMDLIRGKMERAGAGADSAAAAVVTTPTAPLSPSAAFNIAANGANPATSNRRGLAVRTAPPPFAGLSPSTFSAGFGTRSPAERLSMASMLEQTFSALSGSGAAGGVGQFSSKSMPSHVREAYAKLKAFDL